MQRYHAGDVLQRALVVDVGEMERMKGKGFENSSEVLLFLLQILLL